MRAIVMREFGPPEVLSVERLDDPVPAPEQVLVEVEFVSITFVETQVRAGNAPSPMLEPELPLVPGNGVGGRVAALGRDVDRHLAGRRVVTTTGGRGAYAERVAVPADQVVFVPDAVAMSDAVALLADGRTALALIEQAAVQPGEIVLIEAAAGGLGSCLVQLALARGATVVGCAGGPDKCEVVERLGAHLAVDYRKPDWAERVRTEVGPVDLVFDGVGGTIGAAAHDLVRPGGRFSAYGMASGGFTAPQDEGETTVLTLRGTGLTPGRMRELTAEALALAAGGRLRPVVGQTFELAEAGRAHATMEGRAAIGKTLLRIDREPNAGVDVRDPS